MDCVPEEGLTLKEIRHITKRIQAESPKIQKTVIKDKILYLNTKNYQLV